MRFDGVYLFHEEFVDDIATTGAIEVSVPGAGAGEASTALMIENGRITFGDISIDSQRVIISKSSHTQSFPTDGVIGWNLFGHYAVEINYDTEIITLHDSKKPDVDNFWSIVPITMRKDIPFLDCIVEVVEGESVKMSLYIDLASDEALELLTGKEQRFSLPDVTEEMYLGTGLSGDIYGKRGKIKMMSISSFELYNIDAAFAPAEIRSKQEGADGVIGNDFIRRFNVIFDYENGFLFLKSSSFFNTPFE
ncbi:MAG: hypothetical protein GY839_11255 [candidate division Zixibacteria bacterium]|nr:hypothetical protein [candidate division Zixibacteria bacterium]